MVKFSAKVISVGPANRLDGSPAVMIDFGVPIVVSKDPRSDEPKNVLHIQLPGQSLGVAYEHRLVLFLTEEEWDSLDCKPIYGETFVFESTKNGFKLSKEAKK